MATLIRGVGRFERGIGGIPPRIFVLLPNKLTEELCDRRTVGRIEELRLRRDHVASLTVGGKNLLLRTVLSGDEMDGIFATLCQDSLYAHRDSIASGYLTLDGGVRVGICGRAATEKGRVIGVYELSALNFRFPVKITGPGAPICKLLREESEGRGVLIYGPPGEGKTTLLRCIVSQMASGWSPFRVAVIDSRGELGVFLEDRTLCVDLLTGYPRGLGIEIATRTMNAQLIVCDEIGQTEEVEAMLASQNCGVPFVASAHADSVVGLLRRTGIRQLHEARVFRFYVGIRRKPEGGEFLYTITEWEEAERDRQAAWCNDFGR